MNPNRPAWGLWLGRLAFAAGLVVWVVLSLRQLPYCYHDVHYLTSLEWGLWGPSEWVHALFVPLLAAYRWILALLGFSGRMFLPVEYLNVGVGAATLAGVYLAGERAGAGERSDAGERVAGDEASDRGGLAGSAWLAGACALMLGFSHGFWEGALRSDPYSIAAACTVLTLGLLAGGKRPDGGSPADEEAWRGLGRRYLLAGLAAGLTACFHASALSLAPVGLLAAWRAGRAAEGPDIRGKGAGETQANESWLGLGARFLAGMLLVVAFGYLVFAWYHGVGREYFQRIGGAEMFEKVEQMRGTSLWTNKDPARQAGLYANSLRLAFGLPWILVLGALAALIAASTGVRVWRRGRDKTVPPGRDAGGLDLAAAEASRLARDWSRLAASNLVFFSLFFLINNSQNGFVYGALLGLPMAMAALARGWSRWAVAPAALAAAAVAAAGGLPSGPAGDPIYQETRFLDGLLKRGDVLVMPGCPFTELIYERRFNIVPVGERAEYGTACQVPMAGWEKLTGRIQDTLRQGRRVYFTGGDLEADFNRLAGDAGGAQKRRQIFWTAGAPGAAERTGRFAALRAGLEEGFELDCGLKSPQGWRYCGLSEKLAPARKSGKGARGGAARREASRGGPGSPAGGSPPPQALKSLSLEDAGNLVKALESAGASLNARIQARYLAGWLEEAPGDLYAKADLIALAAEEVSASVYQSLRDPDRMLALIDTLSERSPNEAVKLVERAEFFAGSGRSKDAAASLKKAESLGLPLNGLRRAAWLYQSLDECGGALRIWENLAARPRPSAKDFSDKAVCEYRLGRWEAAVSDLEKAIQMAPGGLEAYVSLGAVFSSRGLHDKALETYDRGLRVKPDAGSEGLRRQLVTARDAALKAKSGR